MNPINLRQLFQLSTVRIGLVFLALCNILRLLINYVFDGSQVNETLQIIMMVTSMLTGFIFMFFYKGLHHKTIGITLFYSACFMLNQSVNLFQSFGLWQTVWVIVGQVVMLSLSLVDTLPKNWQKLCWLLAGFSFIYTLHMAVWLTPTYAIMAIGIIFLGLGLLGFIPLISVIHFIRLFRTQRISLKANANAFVVGISLPIVGFMLYTMVYQDTHDQMERLRNQWQAEGRGFEFPLYFEQNPILSTSAELILSQYSKIDHYDLMLKSSNANHHPMAILAQIILPNIASAEEIAHYYKEPTYYHSDARAILHDWTSTSTDSIQTKVDVFADYRLAFVEKTFHVSSHAWHQRNEEARFAFYLPDGAIATSLSLWIDGKEVPSSLTTRQKADNAYNTIVNARRDPARLKWEQGNKLSLHVFPVSETLPRTFKVGFTIPLAKSGSMTGLNDVFFQGPKMNHCEENIHIRFVGVQPKEIHSFPEPDKKTKDEIQMHSDGQSPWRVQWNQIPINTSRFSFAGKQFHLQEIMDKEVTSQVKNVVLDLNRLWTRSQYEAVLAAAKDYDIYLSDDNTILPLEGHEDRVDQLMNRRFSLFPAFAFNQADINNHSRLAPEKTLVITQTNPGFPQVSAGGADVFYHQLQQYQGIKPKAFYLAELSTNTSAYTQMLRELGMCHLIQQPLKTIEKNLTAKQLPPYKENTNAVVLPNSGVAIIKTEGEAPTTQAPDHLLRLFNYGQMIKNLRPYYFNPDDVMDDQISLAEEGHFVSPYTSLISLETNDDYENYQINKPGETKKPSLGNANIFNSGSVPEPHEWALIALAALFFSFMVYKR